MVKRVALLAAGAALVLLTGTGVTLALWNDSETIEGATVSSGTLDITVDGESQITVGPLTGLYPGGVVATRIQLDGQASGNLGLDYAITSSLSDTSSASSTLFSVLDAQIFVDDSAAGSCSTTATPSGSPIYPAGGGYGDLAALSAAGTLVAPDDGSATAYVCARFTIPSGTPPTVGGVELSGAGSSFALVVTGEGTR
ncbi:SipW-dependent-type signal peptide-containing protein [Microbacterium abyssi]|uniref:SipW-dependent-type signal peptide-containing protein n=1 Tax=Microbacterium abyssi TaxID=2782166 RepID=UPI001887951A|nr:SipW-dependent-type signal peptide-containing protein [Microbacterium sp. A18JL241]